MAKAALAGIYAHPDLKDSWIFKGGTCLKKCFFETYRFSEDLDFTVVEKGPIGPDDVLPVLRDLLERVYEASGIDFAVQPPRLRARSARRAAQGRIYYIGPRATPGPASVKLDLDGEERVCRAAEWRPIAHAYDDELPGSGTVQCYSFAEVFAEKLRAMAERGRPRDLYDVVSLFRRSDGRPDAEDLRRLLTEKCDHKGVSIPTLQSLRASDTRAELESEWRNMLGHQLPQLPPLAVFWQELEELFAWLEGAAAPRILPRMATVGPPATAWTPPPTIRTWGGSPVELLRFAAESRLILELDYTDERGRSSRRRVEPYTLYQTSEGNTVLGAFDLQRADRRSFRVDRIHSARVTESSFAPRYATEVRVGTLSAAVPAPTSRSKALERPAGPPPPRRRRAGRPRHVVQCPTCQKRFYRNRHDTRLRAHVAPGGGKCQGRTGVYLGMTS